MHILLIENNKVLCQTLARHIPKAGYILDYTCDGLEGLSYIHSNMYDVIILDCILPSLNGIELLKRIRAQGNATAVIITTALIDVKDRIAGLDAGADDYLTKSFSIDELLARIRALKRRPPNWQNSASLSFSDLSYDHVTRTSTGPTSSCNLSKKEALLMVLFLENPRIILNRDVIFSRIWGIDAPVEENKWYNSSNIST